MSHENGKKKQTKEEVNPELLQKENEDLKVENLILKRKLDAARPLPVVDVNMKDPAPVDSELRMQYVAEVAGFHKKILEPKLLHFIGSIRAEFEKQARETFGFSQSDFDLILKGTINAFWLLSDWGESCINEHINFQTDGKELTEEERQGLKDKINQK